MAQVTVYAVYRWGFCTGKKGRGPITRPHGLKVGSAHWDIWSSWRDEFQSLTFNSWMMVPALLFIERPYYVRYTAVNDALCSQLASVCQWFGPRTAPSTAAYWQENLLATDATSPFKRKQGAIGIICVSAMQRSANISLCRLSCAASTVYVLLDGLTAPWCTSGAIMALKKTSVLFVNVMLVFVIDPSCNHNANLSKVALFASSVHATIWFVTFIGV
eukprot:COSAG01_NODE_2992_length_6743_cov_12.410295_6_plen_217_part_00